MSVLGLGIEQLVTDSVAAGTVSVGDFCFMLTDLGMCMVHIKLWPVSNDGPGHLILLQQPSQCDSGGMLHDVAMEEVIQVHNCEW